VSNGIAALGQGHLVPTTSGETNPTAEVYYSSTSGNHVRDYSSATSSFRPEHITAPATGQQLSAAGYLDMTQLKAAATMHDGGSRTTFSYTSQTSIRGGRLQALQNHLLAAAWNNGGMGGQHRTAGARRGEATAAISRPISNGQGLQETITWANAGSNTMGQQWGGQRHRKSITLSWQRKSDRLPCNSQTTDWSGASGPAQRRGG